MKRLKAHILLENNNACRAKRKKTLTKFLKLNVRMLNTLSRVKYECLQSQ